MAVQGDFQFMKFFENLKRLLEQELQALAVQLEGRIENQLLKKNIVARGALAGSFSGMIVSDAQEGLIAVNVGSPLDYGSYPETGTKPHWAPFEPLRLWVETKLQPHVLAVGFEYTESGRAVPKRQGTKRLTGDQRARAINRVARAIQLKIAQKGTEAKHYMRDALTEMGLQFQATETETGLLYEIDLESFMGPRYQAILDGASV